MATRDSISVTKARLEELKRNVEAQRARRDDYSAIISQQSLGDLLLSLGSFFSGLWALPSGLSSYIL